MNSIVNFRKCTLSDEELLVKVDKMTDDMFIHQQIPRCHIPAQPNDDYDLLIGELILRFGEMIQTIKKEKHDFPLVSELANGWMDDFFSKPHVYNCPIDFDTIYSDYVAYCESSVGKKNKFAPFTFKHKLEDYCREFNIVMQPDVCLNSVTDSKRGYMCVKAWCKVSYFDDPKVWEKDDKVEFRILKHTVKGLFFCKKGEEPKSYEEVKDLCREYYTQPDPEPILDMDDNPITGLTLEQEMKWKQYLDRKQGNNGGGYNL